MVSESRGAIYQITALSEFVKGISSTVKATAGKIKPG